MKNTLSVVSLLFFICSSNYCQDLFLIGISLKPQISTLVGENELLDSHTNSRKFLNAISIGLSLDYYLTDRIGASTGIYYNPQGISNEVITISTYGEQNFYAKMAYLRVPLSFDYYIPLSDKFRIKTAVGLGVNYLLKSDDNFGEVLGFINTIIKDPEDRYNKFVIDAQASAGICGKLSSNLYLSTYFDVLFGLSRFHEKDFLGSDADISVNSRALSLGLNFGLRYVIG